jgi:fructoselysine-6-P-deglycase FrlB-like protein
MSHEPSIPAPGWNPDPAGFVRDLEAKPAALERLGRSVAVRDAVAQLPSRPTSVLFLGMGSSRYAAEVAALRLRARGIHAVAEYGSTAALPPATPELLVVGISASGTSKETLAAMACYSGQSRTVALTEELGSALAEMSDRVIPLVAGKEEGGIACRTFQHTTLALQLIEARLTDSSFDLAGLCARTAEATADLLARRPSWLPELAATLDSPDGVHVLAPMERWSSAAQSALVFREGPRRVATASETGDWNHVDVYLTKTTDYRALLLAGSAYDADAMEWFKARGSTVVSVGPGVAGTNAELRYTHDTEPAVARHTETLVAELIAAHWWLEQQGP